MLHIDFRHRLILSLQLAIYYPYDILKCIHFCMASKVAVCIRAGDSPSSFPLVFPYIDMHAATDWLAEVLWVEKHSKTRLLVAV